MGIRTKVFIFKIILLNYLRVTNNLIYNLYLYIMNYIKIISRNNISLFKTVLKSTQMN